LHALPGRGRRRERVTSAAPQNHGDILDTPLARGHLNLLALVTLPVLVLDQLSKHLVATGLALHGTIVVLPDWLDLTYTLNPGAAFSLFATMPAAFRRVFFVVLSLVAIIVLTVLLARRATPFSSALAFALILGGALGNLYDRLARGVVIDFIYFHHAWFSYPVFNLADSAITIGVALVLLSSAFTRSPVNK
jgi:signal peptidase II